MRPSVANKVPGLFSINERAVYFGHWMHGFIAFAAVGATAVGSIRVHCDPGLLTNSTVFQAAQRRIKGANMMPPFLEK